MLVLAAPHSDDPRDGGYNHALPGELLYRSFVCDTGKEGACGCAQQWGGVASSKATTIAEVVDKPDLTRVDYLNTIGLYLAETWGWEVKDAVDEAEQLADIAEHFGQGTFVSIDIDGNGAITTELGADRG